MDYCGLNKTNIGLKSNFLGDEKYDACSLNKTNIGLKYDPKHLVLGLSRQLE